MNDVEYFNNRTLYIRLICRNARYQDGGDETWPVVTFVKEMGKEAILIATRCVRFEAMTRERRDLVPEDI